MIAFIGRSHNVLLNWLEQDWWCDGPSICVVQGFPGVGKTLLAEVLVRQIKKRTNNLLAVQIECPESKIGLVDDLYLELAEALDRKGESGFADDLTDSGLVSLLQRQTLIVVDELQRSFFDRPGSPAKPLANLLSRVTNLGAIPGRMLLLTSREVDATERWAERCEIRSLSGLSPEDGADFLTQLLTEKDLIETVPKHRLRDIVQWLGGNPRAMHLLVSRLNKETLDELIEEAPEAWEARDRFVSPDFIRRFEERLLSRATEGLSRPEQRFVERLAAFRRPFDKRALSAVAEAGANVSALRDELIARFMIELRRSRDLYAMHPVLRDTLLKRLSPGDRATAHRMAGDYYARHILARDIVGTVTRLGAAFVEARYHYTQSDSEDALHDVAGCFEKYVRQKMGWSTPVPDDAGDLEERINLLSALLKDNGAVGLHYYLARLLLKRGRTNDRQRALEQARKGTGPRSPEHAWLLRMSLEDEFGGVLAAVRTFNDGMSQIGHHAALYHAAAELLEGADRRDEAIQLLKNGIARVQADQNLFSLYQCLAEKLERAGLVDDAAEVLNEGIGRVSPEKGLYSLYICAAEISERTGQVDEAIELLKQGIARVPPEKGLVTLYEAMSALLNRASQAAEALEWLRMGLDAILVGNNRHRLVLDFLYILNIQRDAAQLDAIISGSGPISVDPGQRALAEVLREQVRGAWKQAAQIAASRRRVFPRFIDLAAQEAFACLCADCQEDAAQALVWLGDGVHRDEPNPLTWLNALIYCKQGHSEKADELILSYLGRPLAEGEHADLDYLLRVWDEDAAVIGGPNPAFHFPALPPEITGLADTVIRCQGGATVLPEVLSKIPSGPPSDTVARSVDSSSATSAGGPMKILHLSDPHFGSVEAAELWHGQLAEDLVRELGCKRLDGLILSGDVANYSTEQEYQAAERFIELLSQEFSIARESLVIVPGNHDLNWSLAKQAYSPKRREDCGTTLREGTFFGVGDLVEVRDDGAYRLRFKYFADFFKRVTGNTYPEQYREQATLHHFPARRLLLVGLNSAWEIDHHFTARAGIHPDTVNDVLNRIRQEKIYDDCLKFAVWHHPLSSAADDRIVDHGFIERLAAAGFIIGFHGHIHKSESNLFRYDQTPGGRRMEIVGAGTFGAPVREWVPGYPLQYNLLLIHQDSVVVETRRREELNGTWKPDGRWLQGSGKDPAPRYSIPLDTRR